MTEYIGVDFETGNGNAASICSAGFAVQKADGKIECIEIVTRLHPNAGKQEHSWIHGISQEDTDAGASFTVVYDWLKAAHSRGAVLVSHSPFDRRAFNAACAVWNLPPLEFQWMDSLKTSRRVYTWLESHKLNVVADELGFKLNHHNAGSDAAASLYIFLSDGDPEKDSIAPVRKPKPVAETVAPAKVRGGVDWGFVVVWGLAVAAIAYTAFALIR